MHMICYAHSLDRGFLHLWATMEKTMGPQATFELHQTIEDFKDSLKQPAMNIAVVLLYLNDKEKLPELLSLRSVLIDLPLMIILNDQEPEILKFSHHLRPRVILYSYFGVGEICLVLEKFFARFRHRGKTLVAGKFFARSRWRRAASPDRTMNGEPLSSKGVLNHV